MQHKKCEHCFFKDDPDRGCPCWVGPESGFLEANLSTGEERILTGCYFQIFFGVMKHVVTASNRPAAAFDKLATVTCEGFKLILGQEVLKKIEDGQRKTG